MKSIVLRAVAVMTCGVASAAAMGEPPTPSPAAPAFAAAKPLSESALQKVAGREDLAQKVTATNTAVVAHNTVQGDSTTGAVSFDSNAFQNLRGLAVLNANTGNNVAINASLNVNIAIHQ
jgi:hypothetical protein